MLVAWLTNHVAASIDALGLVGLGESHPQNPVRPQNSHNQSSGAQLHLLEPLHEPVLTMWPAWPGCRRTFLHTSLLLNQKTHINPKQPASHAKL